MMADDGRGNLAISKLLALKKLYGEGLAKG
jgi:hypothetical protein